MARQGRKEYADVMRDPEKRLMQLASLTIAEREQSVNQFSKMFRGDMSLPAVQIAGVVYPTAIYRGAYHGR